MKKSRSKLANWLSFNQHRKRFGASEVAKDMQINDWQKMKTTLISGTSVQYTHGADKNLKQHIDNLRQEFVGQPELNYYHAKLIVLIRRNYETKQQFAQFNALWQQEHEFLIQSLNTRWLISACDTFIDHSEDEHLKCLLMNAVILINTIKLQESERYLHVTENIPVDVNRQHSLQNERLALFDGVAGFAVGTDDTLRNMRWRLDRLCAAHPLGQIVTRIFEQVQLPESDTVYSRFRALHTREKTSWWNED